MNKSYRFTIIIPHYTKSGTTLLERAVSSIPNDKYIQVLIIDNSPMPINSDIYNNRKNIQILYSDNAKGAGHARNVGLDNARGKWLLFLDADDFFVKGAFDIFEEYYTSSNDILFFKMTSVISNTMEIATRHKMYNKIIDDYFITNNEYDLRCSHPSPCAKMVRTKLVKDNNIYFDEVPSRNDVVFGLKIGLAAKNIGVDTRVVYCSTLLKGSITTTINLKNIESIVDVNIRKNKMLKLNGYKKSESVMYPIITSLRYGIKPFSKLFFKALITNNLFVGYNRWLRTFIKRKHLKNREYQIKE